MHWMTFRLLEVREVGIILSEMHHGIQVNPDILKTDKNLYDAGRALTYTALERYNSSIQTYNGTMLAIYLYSGAELRNFLSLVLILTQESTSQPFHFTRDPSVFF